MATAASLLDGEAFNQLVLEEGLKTWEQNGYIYCGKRGAKGWELYRTYGPKWRYLYQARRVATNANAAGNPIIIDITVASGMTAVLVNLFANQLKGGGNNHSFLSYLYDEDNATICYLAQLAAADNTSIILPSIGANATASLSNAHSLGMLLGPGQKLALAAGVASGAAGDTMTVGLTLLLPITAASDGSDISWSVARSTDAANITLAASTISAANTMQAVLLP